jgi:hypothetical protein
MKILLIILLVAVAGCKQREASSPSPAPVTQAVPAVPSITTQPPQAVAASRPEQAAPMPAHVQPIEGAFGWKLGDPVPAGFPVRLNMNSYLYIYQTSTNAPFQQIIINCLSDRRICWISASTRDFPTLVDADDEFDKVWKTLFAKYGKPESEDEKSATWVSSSGDGRTIRAKIVEPRTRGEKWSLSVLYADPKLSELASQEQIRRDQDAVHPVGNGL